PPDQAVPMIVAGLTAQGLGMLFSILIYANYIHRMIQYGLPRPESRAGMFIAILKAGATMTAIFIWSLSLWFFCISALACLAARREMHFRLNWYAFVFPNVGFTIATISIGKSLRSAGVGWVGSAMTVLLVIAYLLVGFYHGRAFVRRDILCEGRDEDTYWGELHHKTLRAEGSGTDYYMDGQV
ncbi:voltage-dependent anion channel-domain-containing protein, partial [Mycena haematopus]